MKRMRKDLYSKFSNNENEINQQIKWMYLAMADAINPDYDDGINKKQFLEIASFIELEITKDIAKAKRLSVLRKTKKFQTRRNLLILENENNGINRSRINCEKIIKSIPIYWYKFRLKLIVFWQWRTEIKCCKQKTNDRLRGHAHRMSMTIDSMLHRNIMNGGISTPSSPRIGINNGYRKHSTWSEDVISECASFSISTEYFVNLLVMFSTIFVILDVYHISAKIQWMADIILYLFLFEVIFKMIAFGIGGYLNDNFNKLDFILSLVAFIFEELLENTIKIIIIFRIIRLLRLLRAFTRFRVILRTTKAVLSSFRSLFILEFCIAYIYAILGMELFDKLITKDIVQDLCLKNTSSDPRIIPFWCNIYDTYYYQNNFNSFTHSIVIQMELIVVNNWHIITEMYVQRTSIYARFYFLSVYFTAVVVVMNVLTAFVLEAFISQYENNENEIKRIMNISNNNNNNKNDNDDNNDDDDDNNNNNNDKNNKYNPENDIEARMHSVIRMFKPENEVTIYHYTRKLSKALFYEQLYPQLFKPQQDEEKSINNNNNNSTPSINTIYSNYTNNTNRSSIHNHLINNINNNISDYDGDNNNKKMNIINCKTTAIEEEEEEEIETKTIRNNNNNNNNDSKRRLITTITPMPEMPIIKSENELEFIDYNPEIEMEILNENKNENENKISLQLHNLSNSNTFITHNNNNHDNDDNDNNNDSKHKQMFSETISIRNFDVSTPTFYGNNNNNNSNHKMFSSDSLTNIVPIIPTLQTPHSQSISTSNVHANYFDAAPTHSHLIAANKNKGYFITMPSNVNKKTSIKSGKKLISSQVSKAANNNIKFKKKNNDIIND